MRFPDRPRVVYALNPLAEVVCQVRFPTALGTDVGLPVDFQKLVSKQYPLLEVKETLTVGIQVVGQPAAAPLEKGSRAQVFDFVSLDKMWRISLASDYIALTTNKYSRWEQFRERLIDTMKNFHSIRSPSAYTRIGLRYQNFIERELLGLEGVPWRELLSPQLLGPLADDSLDESDFMAIQNLWVAKLQIGQAAIRTGIAHNIETKNAAYFIDADFFTEEPQEAREENVCRYVDSANIESRRLFGWCISSRLHEALQPNLVG